MDEFSPIGKGYPVGSPTPIFENGRKEMKFDINVQIHMRLKNLKFGMCKRISDLHTILV